MNPEVKAGQLYREKNEKVKFPRIVRIKRVGQIANRTYVFFEADNPAAQAAHPNGGFIPLDSFFDIWTLHEDVKEPAR